jgi:hypothetical protein
MSGIGSILGTLAGGFLGGPAGALAGKEVGSTIGGALMPEKAEGGGIKTGPAQGFTINISIGEKHRTSCGLTPRSTGSNIGGALSRVANKISPDATLNLGKAIKEKHTPGTLNPPSYEESSNHAPIPQQEKSGLRVPFAQPSNINIQEEKQALRDLQNSETTTPMSHIMQDAPA